MTYIPFVLLMVAGAEPVQVDRPVPLRRTSVSFQRALAARISATWEKVPLRTIVNRISDTQKVAVLLDRRIDPTQEPAVAVRKTTVLDTLKSVAGKVSAEAVVVGNVVYIGPPKSAAALTAAIKARTGELRKQTRGLPARERLKFAGRRTLHWNDLDRPRELVKSFAGKWGYEVQGLKTIPHDLWAGCTLPSVSAVEGLSLLLVQFDQTFRWQPKLQGIAVVPLKPAGKTP